MKQGHFHLHVGNVPRKNGHSAVAAAAYNANQNLTHEQQRQFDVSPDHRKDLRKGIVSEQMQEDFEQHGISLSETATISQHNRKLWTIEDGEKKYTLKEFEERTEDKNTGKRVVTKRALDVLADKEHNYARKNDAVETWVQTPKHAPDWMKAIEHTNGQVSAEDRQRLWNHAEQAEVARDARTAWKVEMSLIRDLDYETNRRLLKEYVQEEFTNKGLVADVAIHSKKASDGGKNTHAHLLLTTREVRANGEFATKKNGYWNSKYRVDDWREAWANKLNGELEAKGIDTRVSHLSNKARGIADKPGEHLGKAATKIEERGQPTEKGNRNRELKAENSLRQHFDASRMSTASPASYELMNQPDFATAQKFGIKDELAYHFHNMRYRTASATAQLIQNTKDATTNAKQKAGDVMRDESSGASKKWADTVQQQKTKKDKDKGHER